jgi:hypothetical protein
MPRLSTGFTIVGAYALKVRRALFAVLRDRVKQDKEWSRKVAYSSAMLNRVLYELLVRRLRLDKGDVVRVRIDFDVDDSSKEVVWRWDTMTVEVFRRLRDEELGPALKEVLANAESISALPRYSLVKLGTSIDGDVLYSLNLNGEEVGVIIVTPLQGGVLIKGGGAVKPTVASIKRSQVKLKGGSLEEAVAYVLPELLQEEDSEDKVRRIIEDLKSRLK